MKLLNQLLTLAATFVLFSSCEKDEVKTTPLTSLAVVNAVFGGTTAKLGTNATNISNNSSAQLALKAGENNLYVWPVADSLKPYYTNAKFASSGGEVYSLFLAGTPASPEGIMVKETIPYRTDSTAGIRFINLAPNTGTKPINITLLSAPTTNDVSSLQYKTLSEFKAYPGLYNSTYTFQIRNDTSAAPKPPLATFALTAAQVPRFANITLVIRQNGTNGLSVFRVNNDR
jgi:hypothetical protein